MRLTEVATKLDIERLDMKLTGEINLMKWMIGALIGLSIAIFVKQCF